MPKPEEQGVISASQNSPCPPAQPGGWRPRRGRKPLAPEDRREHTVSVRLSVSELAALDRRRGKRTRGDTLRTLALGRAEPAQVPPLNAVAWSELARAGSNLNQIAARLGLNRPVELDEISKTLAQFRRALIGK